MCPSTLRPTRDAVTALGAVLFFGTAVVIGAALRAGGVPVHAPAAPLFASWGPHLGPGTVAGVAVATLVVLLGPAATRRLTWSRLLVVAYGAAVAWTTSLALVDGWSTGIAGRLTTSSEYLAEVPAAPPVAALLAGFTERILDGQPDAWATHVAGHPPGALLLFVGLERAGLGGGGWAGVVCITAGASAVPAVGVAVRALAGESLARRALPFTVLTPAAIWVGVSADAVFLAVSAWGIALLAVAGRRRDRQGDLAAVAAGLLLGASVYLSYGLVLMGPIALSVVLCTRQVRPLVLAVVAALAVACSMTAGGFAWWEGYRLVVERYYQGFGGERPYGYWVWANIAALVAAAGPAVFVGMERLRRGVRRDLALRPDATGRRAVRWLVGGAVLAVTLATVSGMSKAEVERIWLPFTVWLTVACLALPRPRAWLAAQAGTALLLQHLLVIGW